MRATIETPPERWEDDRKEETMTLFAINQDEALSFYKSVGEMRTMIAQMARLLQDTRNQMEEMQGQLKKVTVTHDEVKQVQALIRKAAEDFCFRYGFSDPADLRTVRADLRKTILNRWQVKDLHDIPQVALGNVGKLIETYGNIRLVYQLREKHAAGGA